jgi:hypothetical protein
MDRLERIKKYEELYDSSREAVDALMHAYKEYVQAIADYFDAKKAYRAALDQYEAAQEDMRSLEAYYTGEDWKSDYAADEAGQIPEGLKRGVLSQDGINDLLDENLKIMELLETIE